MSSDLTEFGMEFVEHDTTEDTEDSTLPGSDKHRPADRAWYAVKCQCGWRSKGFYGTLQDSVEEKAADIKSSHGQRCSREKELALLHAPEV